MTDPSVTPDEGLRSRCVYCAATRRVDCQCHALEPFASDPGFAWQGFRIHFPHLSVCLTKFVDPVVYYGPAFVSWLASLPTLPVAPESPSC